MANSGSTAAGGSGPSASSSKTGWLPWLLGALVVLGGLTAIDLAFYRDDIHAEAHEEDGHAEEGSSTDADAEHGATTDSDAGEAEHSDTGTDGDTEAGHSEE